MDVMEMGQRGLTGSTFGGGVSKSSFFIITGRPWVSNQYSRACETSSIPDPYT